MTEPTPLEPDRPTFRDMMNRVVAAGACTECGSCVVVCPHRIIEINAGKPSKRPNAEGAPDHCGVSTGVGCDACAAVCPRLWPREPHLRDATFDGERGYEGIFGVYRHVFVARANDAAAPAQAQDGGIVTALLAWARERETIDGAIVAAVGEDDAPCFPTPKLATTVEQIRASAGSWYTYCPNNLALARLAKARLARVAFVGVPCQVTGLRKMERIDPSLLLKPGKSVTVTARQRDCLRGPAERVAFSVGLFCSEVFRPELMTERVAGQLGIALEDVAKFNIKGEVLIQRKDGNVASIPLEEAARDYQRPECRHCADFSAELADISCGGIGTDRATVVVLRTARAVEIWRAFEASGRVQVWPIEQHKKAWNLLQMLSRKQRQRPPRAAGGDDAALAQYSPARAAERALQDLRDSGRAVPEVQACLDALYRGGAARPATPSAMRGQPIPNDPGDPAPGEKRRLAPPPTPQQGGASPGADLIGLEADTQSCPAR